jgi:NhaA family Na+:H+ antiporter
VTSKVAIKPISQMREFIASESASGIILMVAAIIALGLANSPLSADWFHLLHLKIGGMSVMHWINDGLMALFFLLVGLEIKREMLDGQLSTWDRRILPGVAALAGMAVPALIFLFINRDVAANRNGWAVPAATDIAFALGVLAILGRCVPGSLKPFLTAVAVLDDLGAVLIIALFYTAGIVGGALIAAALLAAVLFAFNRIGVKALWPYLLVGLALWVAILQSGVHATVAGVVTALFIPLKPAHGRPDDAESPLHRLEHLLHPWVAYAIVPLFGLANAGVDLRGMEISVLADPLPLGIAMGLFLGKQFGIFAACRTMISMGWAERPLHSNGWHLYGVSVLCGIGFTMSLFIGALAFGENSANDDLVKLGVLSGSLLSAFAGAAILRFAPPAAIGGPATDPGR